MSNMTDAELVERVARKWGIACKSIPYNIQKTAFERRGMKKVRFVWGTPGWGWRMYGLLCLESKKMWFFGLSRQKSEP